MCEQAHQQLKEELGLDHFEGRSWTGLHRHALMTMIAFAFLQHLRLGGRGEKQPRITTRTAAARLVAELQRYAGLAHERPAGEVLYAFLRETGQLGRLAAEDSVHADEALSNIARFFDIVRL